MDDLDDFFDSPRNTFATSKKENNDLYTDKNKLNNAHTALEVNSVTSAKPPAYPNYNRSHIELSESKIVVEAKIPTIKPTVDDYDYSDEDFHDDEEPGSVQETANERYDDVREIPSRSSNAENIAGRTAEIRGRQSWMDEQDTEDESVIVSPLDSPQSQYEKRAKSRPKSALSSKSYANYDRSKLSGSVVNRGNSDATELDELLNTVLKMGTSSSKIHGQRPVKTAKPPTQRPGINTRRNFSFTDDQIRAIDRENERLMKRIIEHSAEAKKMKSLHSTPSIQRATSSASSLRRPSSSAINRAKQLQKIEAENMMLLSRLQKARPSRNLQRDVLVDRHEHRQLGSTSTSSTSSATKSGPAVVRAGPQVSLKGSREPNGSSSDRMSRPSTVFAIRPDDDDILTWEDTTPADDW